MAEETFIPAGSNPNLVVIPGPQQEASAKAQEAPKTPQQKAVVAFYEAKGMEGKLAAIDAAMAQGINLEAVLGHKASRYLYEKKGGI
jgi:hypothetical protein